MLSARKIPFSRTTRTWAAAAAALALLAGCGQKGALYLPTGPGSGGRATLAETLSPSTSAIAPVTPSSAPPVTGTASPVRTP